jgi:hypothetical protein
VAAAAVVVIMTPLAVAVALVVSALMFLVNHLVVELVPKPS